jgi:hypothetical protein
MKQPLNRIKKIAIGIIACLFALFILPLAAIFIVPTLIDNETVRAKVRSEIKERAGVDSDFKHLRPSLFPFPHIIVDQVALSIPPGVRGKAVSLTIHPKILPLFRGKVQITVLRLDSAELDYTLPKKPATKKPASQPFSLHDLGKKVRSVVSRFPEFKMPDLDFRVINSKVKLFDGGRKLLELTEVNFHLEGPPAKRKLTVHCTSNLWQGISMSGLLDTRTFKGSGRIQLKQFRPQGLASYLFAGAALQITDAPANVTIDIETDGPGQLQAEADGAIPHLKFGYEKQEMDIENARFKGSFRVDKNSITVTLAELALDDPQLTLSAKLALTQDAPPISLQVKGTQIDLASTRRVALGLSGKNDLVRDVFDIVKGGNIPLITLKTQGHSLSDLVDRDNIVIRGEMHDGEIRIPDVHLDLAEASGDVVISHGILQVENLQARLGNSWGQNGKLRLGLTGGVAPFHLETDLRAKLSQLLPLLKRQIGDKDVQEALALLKDLKGGANGKLVLSGDTENVKVKVEASDIHFTVRHSRMPYPVEIIGGDFTFDENRVGVKKLSGRLGKSSFSGLTGGLKLGKNRYLEIESGKSRIFLAEIVPWISSFEKGGGIHKYFGGGRSIITLSAIALKGPLNHRDSWHFNVSGDVEDLKLKNLPYHPGPLTITSLEFKADSQTFTYSDGHLSMLDAVWKVSGTHHRYLKGLEKNGKLTVEGHMGPQSIQWISSFWHLPSWIKLRPLTISTSHLSWDTRGETTVSGNLAIQDGLKISVDILKNPTKLVIDKLSIRDKSSQATLGIYLYN